MLYLKADCYRIITDNKKVTRVPKKVHLGDSKQHRVTCVLFLRHEQLPFCLVNYIAIGAYAVMRMNSVSYEFTLNSMKWEAC